MTPSSPVRRDRPPALPAPPVFRTPCRIAQSLTLLLNAKIVVGELYAPNCRTGLPSGPSQVSAERHA